MKATTNQRHICPSTNDRLETSSRASVAELDMGPIFLIQSSPIQSMDESNPRPTLVCSTYRAQNKCYDVK